MAALTAALNRLDLRLTEWMARNGILLLRVTLGIIFLWFGVLKFFPGLSPAQSLAGDTVAVLSFGLLSPAAAVAILAAWESLIGLGLLTGIARRGTLFLLWLQMLGTITPLFLFPELCFRVYPVARPWKVSTSSRTWCSSAPGS